jgi:hypothetical protein
MFEKQKAYYKVKNKDLGLMPDQVELFSIKMAIMSTDLHFMKLFNYQNNNFKIPAFSDVD